LWTIFHVTIPLWLGGRAIALTEVAVVRLPSASFFVFGAIRCGASVFLAFTVFEFGDRFTLCFTYVAVGFAIRTTHRFVDLRAAAWLLAFTVFEVGDRFTHCFTFIVVGFAIRTTHWLQDFLAETWLLAFSVIEFGDRFTLGFTLVAVGFAIRTTHRFVDLGAGTWLLVARELRAGRSDARAFLHGAHFRCGAGIRGFTGNGDAPSSSGLIVPLFTNRAFFLAFTVFEFGDRFTLGFTFIVVGFAIRTTHRFGDQIIWALTFFFFFFFFDTLCTALAFLGF